MNRQLNSYKGFFTSFYFYEGARVTVGIMLPVVIGFYFKHTSWGIAAAIGALAAAITDFPGPIHHRINGILAIICCVFGITIITGSIIQHPLLLGIFIATCALAFAFITVYGNRASQIGTASLIILTLLIDDTRVVASYTELALVTVAGAFLYLLLSLLFHSLRPYKLLQQVLGQCMEQTATYLEVKAGFYAVQPDLDALYQQLTDTQLLINQSQQNVREIMFKTRSMVKESTHTSRVLVLSFLDLVDLFDSMMASQPNYRIMQTALPNHPILQAFQALLKEMAAALQQTGQAFTEGKPMAPSKAIPNKLYALNQLFEETRQQELDKDSIEAFITLRHALDAIEDMVEKLLKLQHYSTYHRNIRMDRNVDYQRFVVPSYFSGRLLLHNVSWQSNVFRFSIRMMVAMVAGYLVSLYLPLGHAYWVLLTIVVILKPAYAITRQRNIDRLLGTLAGVILGAALLYLTANTYLLLAFMLVAMLLSFSFWRHRYFWSVLTLTIFIVIAMHLLHPGNFTLLIKDRLIDTAIGSVIAFVFTLLIPPVWEKIHLPKLAAAALSHMHSYFYYVSGIFRNEPILMAEYKLHRKQVYVSLANFSDAFQRMTNEPKQMQDKAAYWQQLVVSTHVFTSHTAALFTEIQALTENDSWHEFQPIAQQITGRLMASQQLLLNEIPLPPAADEPILNDLHIRRQVKALMVQRKKELEAGQMETSTKQQLVKLKSVLDQLDMLLQLSTDIKKTSRELAA